jgi:hypothetical protein
MASMSCSGRTSLDGPWDVPITTPPFGQKQIRSRALSGMGPSIPGTGKVAVGDSRTSNAIKSSCIDELEGLYRRARGYIDRRIVDLPESEAVGAGRVTLPLPTRVSLYEAEAFKCAAEGTANKNLLKLCKLVCQAQA